MKLTLIKDDFLRKLILTMRFVSSGISSLSTLQGLLIEIKEEKMHLFSTNLNSYIHTFFPINIKGEKKIIIDPKKISEFISLLPTVDFELEIKENKLIIKSGKTRGVFPLIKIEDFPLPPQLKGKKQVVVKDFFTNSLPLVSFAASNDETRPVLTGVNLLSNEEIIEMVATDGFRLSIMKNKKQVNFPSLIIPADFLNEFLRFIKTDIKDKNEKIMFGYAKEEKIIVFQIGNTEFYSRLIEGTFPQFEKVIPAEFHTKVTVIKDDLLRGIKLISIFARDYSYIVIFDIRKDGLYLKPKIDNNQDENDVYLESEIKGEEQKIAFNYRFILDLLNHLDSKEIAIEILRPDAPAVFRPSGVEGFMHLIMPVHIETG